jgi:hypothetical protein
MEGSQMDGKRDKTPRDVLPMVLEARLSIKVPAGGFRASGSGGASDWKIYPFFSDFSGV